jgi:hypothetical protein
MRWLLKYPITAEEVMTTLEKIPEDNPPGTPSDQIRVGGINDFIRQRIIKHFENQENMQKILEDMRV